jgi:hypothetical protein
MAMVSPGCAGLVVTPGESPSLPTNESSKWSAATYFPSPMVNNAGRNALFCTVRLLLACLGRNHLDLDRACWGVVVRRQHIDL